MASEVVQALAGTLSSVTVKQATQQLQEWSLEPAFFATLLQIVSVRDASVVPPEIRLQAILLFKNGLDKWRKTFPTCVVLLLCVRGEFH